MAMPSVVLDTPRQFVPNPMRCGPASVELMLFNRDRPKNAVCGEKLPKVKHSILGGMLPGHMYAELLERGFIRVEKGNATKSTALVRLRELLQKQRPVLLFVGRGIGHWIVLWGYEGDMFCAYDTAKGVQRDARGLTRYTGEELLALWKNLRIWEYIYGPYCYITV